MATLQTIDMTTDKILVTLKISKEEFEQLKPGNKELLLIPSGAKVLDDELTTGKLGNSNRIMLPNKIMKKYGVKKLVKKAPSKIFQSGKDKFLIIRLEKAGVPSFKEG